MRRVAACLVLFAATLGCGEHRPAPTAGPNPPRNAGQDGRARAERILASLPGRGPVRGRSDRPDAAALWQAWFAGPELQLIEERPRGGDASHPNRYSFEHGELFYYTGRQPAAAGSGTTDPAPQATVVAEFRGLQTLRAVRIEHYGEVPLASAAGAAIRARAAELAGAARDERSAAAVRR